MNSLDGGWRLQGEERYLMGAHLTWRRGERRRLAAERLVGLRTNLGSALTI